MAKEKKENLKELKAAYEPLRKKYNLPTFEEIDAEFEIRRVDKDLFIMREIRRAITHRMQVFTEWLEPILNPNPHSLHSMIESKIFEKEEINDMFTFYKHLWHLIHSGISASLRTEKDEVKFIKEIWKEWPNIKAKATKYMDDITKGWAKKEKEAEKGAYLG